MPENLQPSASELRDAFLDYEREVRIRNYKVGCLLAFVFMPAGASLDFFVYPEKLVYFLQLRLFCSVLLGLVWMFLQSPIGLKIYRGLGLLVAFLPLSFISWMIYSTDG